MLACRKVLESRLFIGSFREECTWAEVVMASTTALQVFLNGQRLPIKSFKDYVDLYVKDKDAPRVHERVNDRWEVCICASEGQFQQVHHLPF